MGKTLTNVEKTVLHSDMEINSDQYGNNVAISCHSENCGTPILLTARDGWPGDNSEKPSVCKTCGYSYYIDNERTIWPEPKMLHIKAVPPEK